MTRATEDPSDVIEAILDRLERGEEYMAGGVDYRGPEAVGGHERLWCEAGELCYETVDFHELGGRRDHESRHEVRGGRAEIRELLTRQPALLRAIRERWSIG